MGTPQASRARVTAAIITVAILVIATVVLLIARPWEQSGTPAAEDPASSSSPGPTGDAPVGEPGAPASLIDETAHVLDDGGEGAVEIVEFFDFECPGCAALHPVLAQVRAEYAGEITFAVRQFPLPMHPAAVPAALAAEAAADQGRFAEMFDLLFERQGDWSGDPDAAAIFRGYAEELGLDLDAYDASVADSATLARLQTSVDGGRALGVGGTPVVFIDGERVELSTVPALHATIDAAIAARQ